MARIVVISTAELDRSVLAEHVSADDDMFVVIPAVEQSRLDWLANDERDARNRAREVGDTISHDAPASATNVEVKPDAPSQVVLDAIAEHDPDRIVVALREGEDASWLEEGELEEMPGEVAGIPIARVEI